MGIMDNPANRRGFPISGGSPPKMHPAGRVCEADECKAVLSRYNAGPRCALHPISKTQPRASGMMPKKKGPRSS